MALVGIRLRAQERRWCQIALVAFLGTEPAVLRGNLITTLTDYQWRTDSVQIAE